MKRKIYEILPEVVLNVDDLVKIKGGILPDQDSDDGDDSDDGTDCVEQMCKKKACKRKAVKS